MCCYKDQYLHARSFGWQDETTVKKHSEWKQPMPDSAGVGKNGRGVWFDFCSQQKRRAASSFHHFDIRFRNKYFSSVKTMSPSLDGSMKTRKSEICRVNCRKPPHWSLGLQKRLFYDFVPENTDFGPNHLQKTPNRLLGHFKHYYDRWGPILRTWRNGRQLTPSNGVTAATAPPCG